MRSFSGGSPGPTRWSWSGLLLLVVGVGALTKACTPGDRTMADDGIGGEAGAASGGSGGSGGTPNGDGGTGGGSGGGTGGGEPGTCGGDTYDHDDNPDTECRDRTDCEPGEYVSDDGSPTEDRSCGVCGSGTFSSTENAPSCVMHTECQAGEFVDFAGTTMADQICEPCEPGTFSDDEDVDACTVCPDGTFSDVEGADVCEPWRLCGWSESLVADGTSESDTQCEAGSPFRQFGTGGGDSAVVVAVDADGNVYIAGGAGGELVNGEIGQCYVRKYLPDGTLDWTDQFCPQVNSSSINGIGVDAAGNVYIGGSVEGNLEGGSLGGADVFVRKYLPDGTAAWTDQFGTSTEDNGGYIAVMPSGSVFIAGDTLGVVGGSNAGGRDPFVRKYNSSGGVSWTRQSGSDTGDWATGVATDAAGAVYVVGYTYGNVWGPNAGDRDVYVFQLDTDAGDGWQTQFGTTEDDYGANVVVDAGGNAFVVGTTLGELEAPAVGGQDAFLMKLDNLGEEDWARQFGTGDAESVSGLALDAAGNIYISGSTDGDFVGTSQGARDCLIQRYDSAGNSPDPEQFGTVADDLLNDITVDPLGRVFVVGSTAGTFVGSNIGEGDAFIMQLE